MGRSLVSKSRISMGKEIEKWVGVWFPNPEFLWINNLKNR
jgi:hypothetical protein